MCVYLYVVVCMYVYHVVCGVKWCMRFSLWHTICGEWLDIFISWTITPCSPVEFPDVSDKRTASNLMKEEYANQESIRQ
jgi:hypothetical protein